jgi:hypothetical protein
LTEDPNLVEHPASQPEGENAEVVPALPRNPIRRAGCILALVGWFAILLLPCFLIVLATQQEISITTGDAPGQQIRLWLISEADERGVALSTASVHQSTQNTICVQTDVRYMLWAGSSEPSTYCDCYERASADASWSFITTTSGVCSG